MSLQDSINYNRIADAIHYMSENFRDQPNLDVIAKQIHLSPYHFQRMFMEWAGTTPKKFLQYISIEHAKSILQQKGHTILDATMETGLSSTSRLHDLFVQIEGMTPASYKNGGNKLKINYTFSDTIFGEVIIASTSIGVCYLAFVQDRETALLLLRKAFPYAGFIEQSDALQSDTLKIFTYPFADLSKIKLHLKGTSFQLKVWESLLKIPLGQLTTYGDIARQIDAPNAARAVGTAIGHNPIAYLIPCHRVIQSSGVIGGYMWGNTRKKAIIGWEHSRSASDLP